VLIGSTVTDHTKNGLRKSTVGGSSPETLSQGIKRTAGSHPRESVSAVCQAFGLVCGRRYSGMAPCGPLYSLRSVCRRQGLHRSRPFGIGEPVRYPPYSACKIKSEVLQPGEVIACLSWFAADRRAKEPVVARPSTGGARGVDLRYKISGYW